MKKLYAGIRKTLVIHSLALIPSGLLTFLVAMLSLSFYPQFSAKLRGNLLDVYMEGLLISACGLPSLLYTVVFYCASRGRKTPGDYSLFCLSLVSSLVIITSWYIRHTSAYYY